MKTELKSDYSGLLLRISEGDEESFTYLFHRYASSLEPFIYRFTKSTEATEEIIQEVFLRIWLNREKLPEVVDIKNYIYKYASNECLRFLRKVVYEKRLMERTLQESRGQDTENTREHLHVKELQEIIGKIVETMPKQRRLIFSMSRFEHMNIPEIARKLDISENTVKNTLVTSLRYIKENLVYYGWIYQLILVAFVTKNINT